MVGIPRHTWRNVFLVTGALFLVLISVPIAACTTVAPDPWFRTLLTTDTGLLPTGVTVGYIESGLEVQNRTATPLFLLSAASEVESPPDQLSIAVPDNMIPKAKGVAGQWFVWTDRRWVSTNAQDAAWNATVPRLEDRNRRTSLRPDSVSIPAPQHVQLVLVHKQRVIRVPLTLAYELNPTYNPQRYQEYLRGREACARFDGTQSAPGLFTYLLLPLATVVLLVGLYNVFAQRLSGKD